MHIILVNVYEYVMVTTYKLRGRVTNISISSLTELFINSSTGVDSKKVNTAGSRSSTDALTSLISELPSSIFYSFEYGLLAIYRLLLDKSVPFLIFLHIANYNLV